MCKRRRTGQRDHCLPGLVLCHVYYARSSTMPGPRSVPPSRFITTTTCYPDNPPPPSLPILLQTRPGCPARHLFCRQFKALGVVTPPYTPSPCPEEIGWATTLGHTVHIGCSNENYRRCTIMESNTSMNTNIKPPGLASSLTLDLFANDNKDGRREEKGQKGNSL